MTKPIKLDPIAIVAHHAVTPFGTETESLWEACLEGKSGFNNGFGIISQEITNHCRQHIKDNKLSTEAIGAYQENSLFDWTVYSVLKAFEKAGWKSLSDRDGVIISTTTSFIMDWEAKLIKHLKGEVIDGNCYQPLGAFPQAIQEVLNHKGPCLMVSSACSASTQAIGIARNWMNLGYVDRCLVIGAEQLCHLTQSGFKALSLVSDEPCHPFNEDFGGITLSEAAAVICFEKQSQSSQNIVSGYGCVSDAFSMTSPKPDGSGPARSMKMAMDDAGLRQNQIDWIYAHGTGSLQNDRAEAAAILQLELDKIPVSSSKAVHGHTLAASGALEVILSDYVLKQQKIIPSWKSRSEHFNMKIAGENPSGNVSHILKNTLGFGGINSSLIISNGGQHE